MHLAYLLGAGAGAPAEGTPAAPAGRQQPDACDRSAACLAAGEHQLQPVNHWDSQDWAGKSNYYLFIQIRLNKLIKQAQVVNAKTLHSLDKF